MSKININISIKGGRLRRIAGYTGDGWFALVGWKPTAFGVGAELLTHSAEVRAVQVVMGPIQFFVGWMLKEARKETT
jgi:hypothetical protein